jgi:hypothetical protein
LFDMVHGMQTSVEQLTPLVSSSLHPAPLSEVLARLGERVKPIVLARERTMPLVDAMAPLFPEGELVRGRVISCTGAASMSVASAVVREALIAGAWMAVIDVDTFGADAAAEFGIPLERVVRVESKSESESTSDAESDSSRSWIDVMGAAVDGFDIVVTRVPAGLRGDHRPGAVRKLTSRLVQRGAVVVTIGDTGALGCDVELTTERTVWEGLEDGAGHLRHRRIDIAAGGRRVPARRTCQLHISSVVAPSAQRIEITRASVPGGSAERSLRSQSSADPRHLLDGRARLAVRPPGTDALGESVGSDLIAAIGDRLAG